MICLKCLFQPLKRMHHCEWLKIGSEVESLALLSLPKQACSENNVLPVPFLSIPGVPGDSEESCSSSRTAQRGAQEVLLCTSGLGSALFSARDDGQSRCNCLAECYITAVDLLQIEDRFSRERSGIKSSAPQDYSGIFHQAYFPLLSHFSERENLCVRV